MASFEESIFRLLPQEKTVEKKKVMHKNAFDQTKKVPYSTMSSTGGGFYGKSNGKTDPKHFLKKGTGTTVTASIKNARQHDVPEERVTTPRKLSTPSARERPLMGITSDKNFITANAVSAILSVPRSHQKPSVDYLAKEDYGRVPGYLEHVKREISEENRMIDQFVQQQMGINNIVEEELTPMPEAERLSLVYALKTKWDKVNSEYQRLCHQTSFEGGRLNKKKSLEKQLDEIESDIAKMSRSPVMIRN